MKRSMTTLAAVAVLGIGAAACQPEEDPAFQDPPPPPPAITPPPPPLPPDTPLDTLPDVTPPGATGG